MFWAHLVTARWFGARQGAPTIEAERAQIMRRNKWKIRKSKRAAESAQLPPERKSKGRVCLVLAASVMQANSASARENSVALDADLGPAGIDNRRAPRVSHQIKDFNRQLVDSNQFTKGFGGTGAQSVKIGAIKWKWLDDEGKERKFIVPSPAAHLMAK